MLFYNGRTAVSIDILKSSDANVIQVVDKTYQTLEKLKAQMPTGLNYKVVADSSKGIRASIKDVVRTILEGAGLAVLIVLLFLGSFRSTVITGLTLPITLLGTLTFIWAFGFSINMMTLLALSLSIGLLIDDAIVVRENIVRHTELGKDHVTAALDGTKEIGLAVLATTLTIVAVFFTCCFHGGVNWAFLLPVWGNCKYSCSYFYVYQFYTRPNAFSTLERPGKEKKKVDYNVSLITFLNY